MAQIRTTSELIDRLRSVLLRQRIVLFAAGLMTTGAAGILAWILLALLANIWVLEVWFKVILLLVTILGALYLFGRYAVGRMFGGSVEAVAVALERANPGLKGRLIAAVQFSRSTQPDGFSSELIEAAQQQALERAAAIEFGQVVSFQPLLKTGWRLAAVTLAAVLIVVTAPGFFGYALEVYSSPTTRIAPPVAYDLIPTPGSTEWVKYRDITVGGILLGERFPGKGSVHHRLAGGSWQATEIDLTALIPVTTEAGDSLAFGITFRQADRSFDYYVQAGERRTTLQRVDVVDRPRVTGIHLSIFYPEYTSLAPLVIDENNGSFSAVVGSRVNMKIETNLPTQTAELVFEDGSRTPMTVVARTAQTSLRVDRSVAYHVELVDHLGESNPDPIEYYLTAIPDEFPSVDVVRPGFDVNLNDEMLLPLLVRIFDDYGFTSLVMKYALTSQGRVSEENVVVLHFSDRIRTEGDIEFNWDMDPLRMFPGDYVTYYFEVADNDLVSGPKVSRSRQYIARLPSLDELIAQTEQESRQRISDVEELVRSGKELSRRLKEAAHRLEARSPTAQQADWQQQKELETIAQQNQEMIDRIEKIAEQMDRSLEQMQDNSLMSREIMEKLREIQKLFQEVATPEMLEAQSRMMEMLQQMDPEQLQQAMNDFQMTQEELLQRLERTLTLLKRMQVQAKMEAMIRQAEELVEKQDKVNQDTESAAEEALSDLSRAEKDNEESLANLKDDAQELRELLKEAQLEQSAEANQFAEAVENSDADQNMQQMTQALQNRQRSQASQQGGQASSRLMAMLDQMQQMQMAMNQDDAEELKQRLRRAIEHASNLSTDQEEQIREAQLIDPGSVVIRDRAADQQDLSQACTGLQRTIAQLGKMSPFIAAELRELAAAAVQSMEMATTEFEDKRGAEAIRYQQDAMYQLNRTTTRLMESLDELNQCQNASNCNQSMAQMESLCRKQNSLNQQAQGMCSKPGQGGRPAEGVGAEQFRQGLGRLAAEQGAIRKSLQQLEQEFGGSRQILGRLSDIAREMEKVEEAFLGGEAGPETTERQLRIYSRMLQATRSLQRKDFTQQRRATTAEDHPLWVPNGLPQNLLDDRLGLEDRLRRFLSGSYPPQYEEQIKAYFRALLKSQAEVPQVSPSGESER